MNLFILATLLLSIVVGMFAMPIIVFVSKKLGIVDKINSRKSHTIAISRLGGVAFLPAFYFSLCLFWGGLLLFEKNLGDNYTPHFLTQFMFFTAGIMPLYFIGLFDDLVDIDYKLKFGAQMLASALLCSSGLYIRSFGGLFGVWTINPYFGFVFTLLLIVLVVNSFNLIDGVDGLCSSLAMCAIVALSVWFWIVGMYLYTMVGFAILGSVAVFFYYNVVARRRKLFMGDAGALMLGYIICFLGLKFISVSGSDFGVKNGIVVLFSLVFVPLFDTLRVFTERIVRGKHPFTPDRSHIHHYLLQLGFSHLQTTLIILTLALILIIFNIFNRQININLLFAIDIVYGILLLCIVPKLLIRRGVRFSAALTRCKPNSKRCFMELGKFTKN
ncbi:MAG: MraY family glycosyltransferase [Rikenellaceae bacterium]